MALQLHFYFLVLFMKGFAESLTAENLMVMEGQTLLLNCPIDNASSSSHLEWKNPHGFVIFFNDHKALRDKRYGIVNYMSSEFVISLSNVTFKDGGFYTCLQYTHPVTTKRFKVTVLGVPKLETTEHDGKTAIKCSAQGNFPPPKISWLFEGGLEVDGHPQYHCEKKLGKCTSVDILLVRSHKRRTVLKCLVQHQALYSSHLMNFVTIVNDSIEESQQASTAGYWLSTPSSKEQLTELTTGLQFGTQNETIRSVAVTTEPIFPNSTSNSSAEDKTYLSAAVTTEPIFSNSSLNSSTEGTSSQKSAGSKVLIVLVTCLITCLLVVVIFFATKLRRAHALWKKENEDTDQSLESSKSKSSNEEKSQRGQGSGIKTGFHNTSFMKYVREQSVEKEATAKVQNEEIPQPQNIIETHKPITNLPIKETEL